MSITPSKWARSGKGLQPRSCRAPPEVRNFIPEVFVRWNCVSDDAAGNAKKTHFISASPDCCTGATHASIRLAGRNRGSCGPKAFCSHAPMELCYLRSADLVVG